MGITSKRHRRNLSYEDAADLDQLWELSKHFDRSFYREWQNHWDERGYTEYIVVTEGRSPFCESPEEYVCRMESMTDKQRREFCKWT